MLSRSIGITRTPGESPQPARVRSVDAQVLRDARLKGRMFWRMIVLAVIVVVFAALLLLNVNTVVEPRVRLLLINFDRPGLLPVLLSTSLLSVAGTIAALAVFSAKRQLDDARGRSLTDAIQLEASRIKHAGAPQPPPFRERQEASVAARATEQFVGNVVLPT